MSEHLAAREADRLRRAESRWLEQARERLRRRDPRPSRSTPEHTATAPTEETDR